MKKMKFFALATVVILLANMTSCNDKVGPEESPVDVKEKKIFLKMGNVPQVGPRSESASGLGLKAKLTTGVVVFVNGDEITRYVDLTTTGSSAYIEPNGVDVPAIKIEDVMSVAGVTFTNIKADKVYIIGNRSSSELTELPAQGIDGKIASGSRMTNLIKSTNSELDVTNSAHMGDGEHEKVVLYGMSLLSHVIDDQYKANVELIPVVARLEIKEVFGSDVNYRLKGIFINNYYSKAQTDGIVAASTSIKNNLSLPANYVQNYHAAALSDWSESTLGTKTGTATIGVSSKPTTGVWGYNVFAAKNVGASDKNLPRVVLRFADVKDALGAPLLNPEGLETDKFITVTGFSDGTNPITEFKKGHIYTITKIIFDKSNLTEEPEINDRVITAIVSVSIRTWDDGGIIIPEL